MCDCTFTTATTDALFVKQLLPVIGAATVKKYSLKAHSWIGEPSKEVILKVEERINHIGTHLVK